MPSVFMILLGYLCSRVRQFVFGLFCLIWGNSELSVSFPSHHHTTEEEKNCTEEKKKKKKTTLQHLGTFNWIIVVSVRYNTFGIHFSFGDFLLSWIFSFTFHLEFIALLDFFTKAKSLLKSWWEWWRYGRHVGLLKSCERVLLLISFR